MSGRAHERARVSCFGPLCRDKYADTRERLKTEARRILRDSGLNRLCSDELLPPKLRALLLRAFGLDVDTTCRIYPRCFFGGTDIHIGPRTFINIGCFFDNTAAIHIGADCSLGMGVLLCTSSHDIGEHNCRAGAVRGAPVVVEDGCWIGANSILLPGVTVHGGCVVAAGSVVVHDCDADGLYAGNPAKRVRDLEV